MRFPVCIAEGLICSHSGLGSRTAFLHRHFPGQVVDKRHILEFNQRCESIITALSGCDKAVRLPSPEWLYVRPSTIHMGNRLWR